MKSPAADQSKIQVITQLLLSRAMAQEQFENYLIKEFGDFFIFLLQLYLAQEYNKLESQYTSKNFDPDIGLYYYNARWYDPELGRFITEDPARDGNNWFIYALNNPLRYLDPTGLRPNTSGLPENMFDHGIYYNDIKEPAEQTGRWLALGTSATEAVVGLAAILILAPESSSSALGAAVLLFLHGPGNTVAAGVSIYEYERTNGQRELATSMIGISAQLLTEWGVESSTGNEELAAQIGGLMGSLGDIGDSVMSANLLRSPADAEKLMKVVSLINISGDVELSLLAIEDFMTYSVEAIDELITERTSSESDEE